MKRIFFFILLLACKSSIAQTLYVDVLTAPALIGYGNAIKGEQNKTNSHLTKIEAAQALVFTQLTAANTLHNKIYNGLSQVSEGVKSLLVVKEIGTTSADIIAEITEAAKVAAGNPVYALFAEQGATEFRTRAVALALDVTNILKPGELNLMDAGERNRLLNNILTQLKLMYATAYGITQSIYWAKMDGLWKSINPYSGWVNQDRAIMADIIRNSSSINP